MKTATITAVFNNDISSVWNVVTDNQNYHWRSDLSEIIEGSDGKSFVERANNGFETHFSITLKKPFERYEFDLVNQNMTGHWVGVFTSVEAGTRVEFTESASLKNPLMNLVAGIYLKKQQQRYIEDLRKALKSLSCT